MRGERLNLLVNKTENLTNGVSFDIIVKSLFNSYSWIIICLMLVMESYKLYSCLLLIHLLGSHLFLFEGKPALSCYYLNRCLH